MLMAQVTDESSTALNSHNSVNPSPSEPVGKSATTQNVGENVRPNMSSEMSVKPSHDDDATTIVPPKTSQVSENPDSTTKTHNAADSDPTKKQDKESTSTSTKTNSEKDIKEGASASSSGAHHNKGNASHHRDNDRDRERTRGGEHVERPPNCRIFLGNLASEKTSEQELLGIFSKYGNIIENIVLCRSYGFIQYSNTEEALAAIEGENGRKIGGLQIDLSIADNRESIRRKESRDRRMRDGRKDRDDRDRSRFKGRRDNRDDDRGRGRTDSYQDQDYSNREGLKKRRGWSPEPPASKRQMNKLICQIIFIEREQREYAQMLETHCRQLGVLSESRFGDHLSVVELIGRAQRRRMLYVFMLGPINQQAGTVNLYIINGNSPPQPILDINFRHGLDIIAKEEGLAPLSYAPQPTTMRGPAMQNAAPPLNGNMYPPQGPPQGMPPSHGPPQGMPSQGPLQSNNYQLNSGRPMNAAAPAPLNYQLQPGSYPPSQSQPPGPMQSQQYSRYDAQALHSYRPQQSYPPSQETPPGNAINGIDLNMISSLLNSLQQPATAAALLGAQPSSQQAPPHMMGRPRDPLSQAPLQAPPLQVPPQQAPAPHSLQYSAPPSIHTQRDPRAQYTNTEYPTAVPSHGGPMPSSVPSSRPSTSELLHQQAVLEESIMGLLNKAITNQPGAQHQSQAPTHPATQYQMYQQPQQQQQPPPPQSLLQRGSSLPPSSYRPQHGAYY